MQEDFLSIHEALGSILSNEIAIKKKKKVGADSLVRGVEYKQNQNKIIRVIMGTMSEITRKN